MHEQGKGFRALFGVQRMRLSDIPNEGAGASNSTRYRQSGMQSTGRFPPTGCGRQGNGPVSLRVELDTDVFRRCGPYHNRSTAATADRLFKRNCGAI
jgi:hypothetical protein